jgi:DNA-binding FadR family transcriptional regulator
VAAQRGSGVVVRPRAEWSAAVLPSYLRHGAGARDPQQLALLVRDLLALRRGLVTSLMRILPSRVKPGALDGARAHIERAWTARREVATFVRHDLDAMRALVEAAQFLPGLWLLSELSGVYESIAAWLTGPALAPNDYVAAHRAVYDALEHGRGDDACRVMQGYLERHDQRMLAGLGIA